MCRPFYRVWGRSRPISAHDETTCAPSSWHLRSSNALWRARTQAHCNSQKLAAGQKITYTTHGQFTHTSSGHKPSPVPARCTPHGQGTCRSGRQDIGPSNSFPRRVPTHRERATRRAPWEGEGQSRRQDIGPSGSAPPAHRKAELPNAASPDTAGAGNVGPAPAAGDAGPVTTGIGSTGTAGISAFGTGGPFGNFAFDPCAGPCAF